MSTFVSKVSVKDGGGDFDFSSYSRELYRINADNVGEEAIYNANALIKDLRVDVTSYRQRFERDYVNYLTANSMLRKMKDSLTSSRSSTKVAISAEKMNNHKKATIQFMKTMQLGHTLLLKIRETLTGQNIRTKMMIQYDGKLYEVYEDEIQDYLKLSFSKFGGGTKSNPFSLAYQLDIDVLAASGLLNEEHNVDNNATAVNLYKMIYDLKPEYLRLKSMKTGRSYPNIFFDSKDTEIIELLQQEGKQNGTFSIDVERYAQERKRLGGGGGYATAFYKMGDIGSTQVKFFNFKGDSNIVNVNFARFSLLRDRFRDLEYILSKDDTAQIMQSLQEFFTEKEENVDVEMNKDFNDMAKSLFKQWIT